MNLTPEQVARLQKIIHSRKTTPSMVTYAKVILDLDESGGKTPPQRFITCAKHHISLPSLNRILSEFTKLGFDEFFDGEKVAGRRSKLTLEQEQEIVALIGTTPPPGHKRWTFEALGEECRKRFGVQVGVCAMRSMLARHGSGIKRRLQK